MRILKIIFIIVIIFCLIGCTEKDNTIDVSISAEPSPTPNPYAATVGVSLTEQTPFNKAYIDKLQALCDTSNYQLIVKYADNKLSEQLSNVVDMLNNDVNVIVLDTVDIDESEPTISECEMLGIPIIGVISPINGPIKVLISPDYIDMGKKAGEQTKQLTSNTENPFIAVLEGSIDGFRTQMINDGFISSIGENVSLQNIFCDFDRNTAYEEIKSLLQTKTPNAIFSHSSEMTLGALTALEEKGASVPVVTLDADGEIITNIQNGKVSYAIYYDPEELAQKTFEMVKEYCADPKTQTAAYVNLSIFGVSADNLDKAYTQGDEYAHKPADN